MSAEWPVIAITDHKQDWPGFGVSVVPNRRAAISLLELSAALADNAAIETLCPGSEPLLAIAPFIVLFPSRI